MEDDSEKATEWWWVDYLENEMDLGSEKDLQLLLEHSQEDRDSFEQIRLLREWLRDSDPVREWPMEARLTRIRANVMQTIEQEEKLKRKAEKEKSYFSMARLTKSLSV